MSAAGQLRKSQLKLDNNPFGPGANGLRTGRPLQTALGELIRHVGLETKIVVVAGSAGTGKTLLAEMVARSLTDMGLSVRRVDRGDLMPAQVSERTDVILIDEADCMGEEALQSLLKNGGGKAATTTIFLCLPSSVLRFSTGVRAALVQLQAMSVLDARSYLLERSASVGRLDLFVPEASELAINGSHGLPRLLRSIAELSFVRAALDGASEITMTHVAHALASQMGFDDPVAGKKVAPAVPVPDYPVINPEPTPVSASDWPPPRLVSAEVDRENRKKSKNKPASVANVVSEGLPRSMRDGLAAPANPPPAEKPPSKPIESAPAMPSQPQTMEEDLAALLTTLSPEGLLEKLREAPPPPAPTTSPPQTVKDELPAEPNISPVDSLAAMPMEPAPPPALPPQPPAKLEEPAPAPAPLPELRTIKDEPAAQPNALLPEMPPARLTDPAPPRLPELRTIKDDLVIQPSTPLSEKPRAKVKEPAPLPLPELRTIKDDLTIPPSTPLSEKPRAKVKEATPRTIRDDLAAQPNTLLSETPAANLTDPAPQPPPSPPQTMRDGLAKAHAPLNEGRVAKPKEFAAVLVPDRLTSSVAAAQREDARERTTEPRRNSARWPRLAIYASLAVLAVATIAATPGLLEFGSLLQSRLAATTDESRIADTAPAPPAETLLRSSVPPADVASFDSGPVSAPPPIPPVPATPPIRSAQSGVPVARATGDASLPAGRVYGGANTNSRVTIRIHKPMRVQVHGRNDRILLFRTLEAGDTYRVPRLPGVTITVPDAGAVEIMVDEQSEGSPSGTPESPRTI